MTCCRRNALVALDLIVTVIAGGLTLVAAVAGICGMNLAPLPIQDNNVSFSAFNCQTLSGQHCTHNSDRMHDIQAFWYMHNTLN